jgi:predicted nucleic acid-binding protein
MADNIVVSDAGPLHYLILIDCAEVLATLFNHVLVPLAVRDELIHPGAPQKVKDWMNQSRPWLKLASVSAVQPVRGLHRGETEALQLAVEHKAVALLMDDMDGRAAARQLGLPTVFTVAILELGAERGLLDLPTAIAKLRQTSFFVSQEILDAALERDKNRRRGAKEN